MRRKVLLMSAAAQVNGRQHPASRPTQVTMEPIVIPGRTGNEFRAAAGLASWSPAVLVSELAAQAPLQEAGTEPGPATAGGRLDGDTAIRALAAVVVLAVAAFAAIVSYSHIFDLGVHHGQNGTAARLLPLSVDGLIASASLVMLHAARRKLDVPWLARAMLALGVGATVAANVGYGLPFGWLSAVVSAWPAVAFVGSVEMAVRFVRDARHDSGSGQDKMPAVRACDTRQAVPLTGRNDAPRQDRTADRPQGGQGTAPVSRSRAAGASGRAGAAAILKDKPGLPDAEVAKLARVSVRTVQRARNDSAGSTA
jgi:hypothetical protein